MKRKLLFAVFLTAALFTTTAAALTFETVETAQEMVTEQEPSEEKEQEQAALSAVAEDFSWTLENGVLTISGQGDMPDYDSKYNGNTYETTAPWSAYISKVVIQDGITSIGEYAFYGCKSLTSITIPDGVTSIGAYAFYGCTGLTSIAIPDSVTSIGELALKGCDNITELYLSDILAWCNIKFGQSWRGSSYPFTMSVTLYLKGTKVTNLVIPEGVTYIPEDAFCGCTNIISVTMPDSLVKIGDFAFAVCTNLLSLSIPDGVTSIEIGAFTGCKSLESIAFPDSLESIGTTAFSSCDKLTKVNIPKSVTDIGEEAFGYNNQLSKITVDSENQYYSNDSRGVLYDKDKTRLILAPRKLSGSYTVAESTTVIGTHAFQACVNMNTIVLSERLECIENGAFESSGITSIILPKNVSTILGNPFVYAGKLSRILVDSENPNFTNDSSGVLYSKDKSTLIVAPMKISGTYVVPEGVKYINKNAFEQCPFIKTIVLPNSLETLEDYSFINCKALTKADIPANVSQIAPNAFYRCKEYHFVVNLENNRYASDSYGVLFDKDMNTLVRAPYSITNSYKIPGSVTVIGGRAFEDCENLRSLIIPDGVVELGSWVFWNCKNLKCITIPKSVKTIGWNLFLDCPKLTDVYFTGTKDEWELAKPKYSEIIPDNVTLHYEESAPEALSGDLNGDGEVTDSDAIYLLYHTFFEKDYPLNQPCDFNGDGEVTDSDAVYLLYNTFFPNEYPLK